MIFAVLYPMSHVGWMPAGLLESWFGPLYTLWIFLCGIGLLAAWEVSGGGFSGGRWKVRLGIGTVMAASYALSALVHRRFEPLRGLHPARMPGEGGPGRALEPADLVLAVLAGGMLAGVWWWSLCRLGKRTELEGEKPC